MLALVVWESKFSVYSYASSLKQSQWNQSDRKLKHFKNEMHSKILSIVYNFLFSILKSKF